MRLGKLVERIAAAQRDLGPLLRFEVIVPFTVVVWVAGGSWLTLPAGPLCDEGMVLFMEGGCDWGGSNIFFFAKASLLLTMNLALVAAWLRPPVSWRGLLPHFALLGVLAYVFRSGGYCDSYYAHPNGSLGQMVLEMAAFAALGVALGRATTGWRWLPRLGVLAAWNGLHVGLFYLYLGLVPHWTWTHTAAVGGTLVALAGVVWRVGAAGAADGPREALVADERGPGRWPALSVYFIAATLGLIGNPFGLAPIFFLCLGVGLATAAVTKPWVGGFTARSTALLVALAIPAYGVVRSSADYAEQARYASSLLAAVGSLSVEEAAALEAVASAARRAAGDSERVDLSDDATVRGIAERVAGARRLRNGSTLSVFVPLDEGRTFRLGWWCYGECDGSRYVADVLDHLVTEHSYLEGHEAVTHFAAGGRSPWPSRASYVVDSALRWRPPTFYSAATTVDDGGRVRAMVVVGATPQRLQP